MKKFSAAPAILIINFLIYCININAMNSSEKMALFHDHANSYLQQLANQDEFSGSVLIALNDKIVLRKGYGFARPGMPNSPTIRFCIGSITKSFTAMLILQLAQEEKLNLNDPVQKYIPEFQHEAVTIHHLLTMTSGLPCDFWKSEYFSASPYQTNRRESSWGTEYEIDVQNNKDSLGKSYAIDLLFTPGEKFEYSNIGYLLLQKIIELIDDSHSYAASLHARIFNPLNMHYSSAASDHQDPQYATSQGIPVVNLNDNYAVCFGHGLIHGSGSIVSTIDDMYAWAQCINQEQLLNYRFDTIMKDPLPFDDCPYACGLVVEKNADKKTIWHNGQMSHFNSYMGTRTYNNEQQDQLTIIILANKREVADKIARDLYFIFENGARPTLQELSNTTARDIETDYEGIYQEETPNGIMVKNPENFIIKHGNFNTLWFCKEIDHMRLLKRTEKDCFGSNMLEFKLTFKRNSDKHVTGFTINGITTNTTECFVRITPEKC